MFRPTVQQRFFERHGIGPMTDDGRHGEGQHDQRDVTVPAMPGTAFVVIETEFVLGGLEAVLDGPAMAFDQHQLLHWRALGAPGGEVGQIAILVSQISLMHKPMKCQLMRRLTALDA